MATRINRLPRRIVSGLKRRITAFQLKLFGPVAARWGTLARLLLYPTSRNLPYRRTRLAVARWTGLGDALMCTPGLRELKRINPECHLTFFTLYKEVFEGLPYLDEVRHLDEARQVPDTIWFIVEESGGLPTRGHPL